MKRRKPKCQQCRKTDKVVRAFYGSKNLAEILWKGWECERCWTVVKEVKLTKEK